ncbi:hypothetical protein ACVT98_09680 [Vibrio campbellii]
MKNKKIIPLAMAIATASFGSIAAEQYVLTESSQGSGIFFEKADTDTEAQRYDLTKNEDGSILFSIAGNGGAGAGWGGGDGNDKPELGPLSFVSVGAINDFEEAKRACRTLELNGEQWRILDQADMDALAELDTNIDAGLLAKVTEIVSTFGPNQWMTSDEQVPTNTDYAVNIARINPFKLDEGYVSYEKSGMYFPVETSTICVVK